MRIVSYLAAELDHEYARVRLCREVDRERARASPALQLCLACPRARPLVELRNERLPSSVVNLSSELDPKNAREYLTLE